MQLHFADFKHAVAKKLLSDWMVDDNEGLFSPGQEKWIKELVSGLQWQRNLHQPPLPVRVYPQV